MSPLELGKILINYSFKPAYFFIAPTYLTLGSFILFLLSIAYNRVDFDFKHSDDKAGAGDEPEDEGNEIADQDESEEASPVKADKNKDDNSDALSDLTPYRSSRSSSKSK